MDSKKTSSAKSTKSSKQEPDSINVDYFIDEVIKRNLSPFHGKISEVNMGLNDPDLDIAMDKLAQCMTALQRRSKRLSKEGDYGKIKHVFEQ